MDTNFIPTFCDSVLDVLNKCAEQMNTKMPETMADYEALRATIKERAEQVLQSGSNSDIVSIIAIMNAFKPIYLKAVRQKQEADALLQQRKDTLKTLIAEF